MMRREIRDALDDVLRDGEPDWTRLASFIHERRADSETDEGDDPVADLLVAFAVHEPDDASHWWNLATRITNNTQLTKALLYLLAADAFTREAQRGDGLTGDEDDWAESARLHAAKELADGGCLLAAAVVAMTLPPAERAELTTKLGRTPPGGAHRLA